MSINVLKLESDFWTPLFQNQAPNMNVLWLGYGK